MPTKRSPKEGASGSNRLFFVGIFRVLLVGGDELEVKVKIDEISGIEPVGGVKALQRQRVHLLVHAECI